MIPCSCFHQWKAATNVSLAGCFSNRPAIISHLEINPTPKGTGVKAEATV